MTITSIQPSHTSHMTQVYRDSNGNLAGSLTYIPANSVAGIGSSWNAEPIAPSEPMFEKVNFRSLQAAEYFLLAQAIERDAQVAALLSA